MGGFGCFTLEVSYITLQIVWNSGVVAEDPIVTSCGTGVTACILALV